MDYDFIDVLDFKKSRVNTLTMSTDATIYVHRKFFDTDLMIGFSNPDEAHKQLERDIPRSKFYYNGLRYRFFPSRMPENIIPYCTQAVMGLPVSILTENIGIVCESGSPLYISAFYNNTVQVVKELFIRDDVGSDNICKVKVIIIVLDECVIIRFVFTR